MKRNTQQPDSSRRGSTLLIVLALLSLLAFTGMVFYTFSAQERSAADYFSEAAKAEVDNADDPFPWALQQILTGATNNQKASILWSPRRRLAMLSGVVGYDAVPYSGPGVNIIYNAAGLPVVDQDNDGTADTFGSVLANPLNFVDGLAAWRIDPLTALPGTPIREQTIVNTRGALPEPDVDYTYPDINNIWLAHRGWAIRDNGPAASAGTRYERVPVIIPSFLRPALMKSGTSNGFGGFNAPTDLDWFDHSTHPIYSVRSFRPSERHLAGFTPGGVPVRRFLDNTNPADAGLVATHGAFPLRPGEDVNPVTFGRLGLLTGHSPGAFPGHNPTTYRLDQDNDGDGVFEGIWIDLSYPVQQTAAGDLYSTLFSFTIYDLDSLIDLNSHGNMSHLLRNEIVTDQFGAGATGSTPMSTTPSSASHQGLGPHEVSPLFALAPTSAGPAADPAYADPLRGYNTQPVNRLEQANMEWLWLLTGRIDSTDSVWDGRWGDANALWYHVHHDDGAGGNPGQRRINTLPRPGRAGDFSATTNLINFGGRTGFDDNQTALEGIASTRTGVIRGFRHPLDIGATGRTTVVGDPRIPDMFKDLMSRPEQWLRYDGYSLVGSTANVLDERKYLSGRDQDIATTTDNTFTNPRFNLGFEDPQETLNDNDYAIRPDDAIFAPGDLVPAHLTSTDAASATTKLSDRLSNLVVEAFKPGSDISERFTTISNSLRAIAHRHDLGPNLVSNGGGGDDGPRWWEWSADTDNDGRGEFPPQFGAVAPYSPFNGGTPGDPFRAVVRRLLATEVGETRQLISQLPLSVNHILDVNRTEDTPPESSPQFLAYLQKAGMRFRALTEHPHASETDSSGQTFAQIMTTVPRVGTPAGDAALSNFPPRDFAEREFWARRDRQQLARDIYVLLYTIGGAELNGSGDVQNAAASVGTTIYTHAELRRMAQFAVNMVDAMDTDDIVTMFEYDKDLSDGWGLDDDPYTDNPAANTGPGTENGMYPLDTATRGVVFGVEAQQLTLSESLAVRLEDFAKYDGASDDPTTMFNDASGMAPLPNPDTDRRDRYVLHLELQNNQPYPVALSVPGVTGSSNSTQAIWQLARVDRIDPNTMNANDPSDAPQASTLDPIANPTGVDGTTMSFMEGNPDISGGGRFSIAMASTANTSPGDGLRTDPLGIGTAELFLQKPMATDYSQISPDNPAQPTLNSTTATRATSDATLDTIETPPNTRYVYDNGVPDFGHFLREIPYSFGGRGYYGNEAYGFDPADTDIAAGPESGQGFEIVLRRRLNPNLPLVPLTENPWVEVDRIRVEFKDLFNFTTNMGSYTATPELEQITSDERSESLDSNSLTDAEHPPATSSDYRYNTIAHRLDQLDGVNDATTTVAGGIFSLWQPHFDRDFASVAELFHLPVIGPRLLTERLNRMRYAPAQQSSVSVGTVDATGDPNLIGSAVAMFLQPDVLPVGNDANDNAWYRLLQFVEVPSRVNTMLGNYLTRHRLPGKVNLNGIRHIEVYAGLIDDALIADVPIQNVPGGALGNDINNQYAPFMHASVSPIPMSLNGSRGTGATGLTAVNDESGTPIVFPTYKDRWFEYISERDGATAAYDPVNARNTTFWIPGTPNAKPFRSLGFRKQTPTGSSVSDTSLDDTVLRRFNPDATDGSLATNRHWLELGSPANHNDPNTVASTATQRERHLLLSKLLNNTTTVSNTFIIYGTAAYFDSVEDPTSGLIRVGGRMGLDLDGDGNEQNDPGWEKRAVFVVDRTELLNAYDPGTGSFDWQRLIKYRADLASDGQ
ncbi:MAG: hypothetical protein RIK87_12085 [Fuerstiella sp.]